MTYFMYQPSVPLFTIDVNTIDVNTIDVNTIDVNTMSQVNGTNSTRHRLINYYYE